MRRVVVSSPCACVVCILPASQANKTHSHRMEASHTTPAYLTQNKVTRCVTQLAWWGVSPRGHTKLPSHPPAVVAMAWLGLCVQVCVRAVQAGVAHAPTHTGNDSYMRTRVRWVAWQTPCLLSPSQAEQEPCHCHHMLQWREGEGAKAHVQEKKGRLLCRTTTAALAVAAQTTTHASGHGHLAVRA